MAAYNPGTPGLVIFDKADGTWLVKSFREPNAAYRVSLEKLTCCCPHFRKRLAGNPNGPVCKHLTAAAEAEQAEFEATLKPSCLPSEETLRNIFA